MDDLRPWQQPLVDRALQLKTVGRLPHAVLLESKSTELLEDFLRGLANVLLCENVIDARACGNCRSCREFSNHVFADYRMVGIEYNEKTKKDNKNISIEQIRDLIHEVRLSKSIGDLKIAVIYPAEKMSLAAANSLLKTLEEPAQGVLLLLATHNKGRLPVTIRSRCQHWTLETPDETSATEWLVSRGMTNDEAGEYLEYAGKDPALALELKQKDYGSSLSQFRSGFTDMLQSRLSVSELAGRLVKLDLSIVRQLLFSTTRAYASQFVGLAASKTMNKAAAQSMLQLDSQMQRQLAIEENNLDLQLQLEDVLISLKQVILRSRQ